MLDRVTSSQADPWSRAWHHKTPVCPLVKRCHNLSTWSKHVTSVTLHVPRRAWLRDSVTQTRPLTCTEILSIRDCVHIETTWHKAGRVIRPFVLVSPFFLWSLWPRARSQVLRMLRIYLAIRELANKHPAASLHFALLQLHRCMHVIYDVLTIIWNAGNVTRSLLISLKGMKQTSMIRYSGWHKIM